MADYTQNYGLHQWEPGDSFLRGDFNGDFAKIDAALAQRPYVVGQIEAFQGSNTIELGFKPSCGMLIGYNKMLAVVIGDHSQYFRVNIEYGNFVITRHETGITISGVPEVAQSQIPVFYVFFK